MAIRLAPLAGFALRYGALTLAAYAASRRLAPGRIDPRAADAMDDSGEGVALRADGDTAHGTARLRRTIRLGAGGPGVELDAAALGRIRVRRL